MRPVTLLVTLLLAAALTPFPDSSAQASCVGPQLAISGHTGSRPPEVRPATAVTVDGRFFVHGCDDTGGQTSVLGCERQAGPREEVTPMRRVALVLRQHGREWPLGSADARGHGRISWEARLPAGLRPGRALLLAGGSELPVVAVPRR